MFGFLKNPKIVAAIILGLIALYFLLPIISGIFKAVVLVIVVAIAVAIYKVKRKVDSIKKT